MRLRRFHVALLPVLLFGIPSAATYTGPCDVVSSCAVAYSVTRAMLNSYHGNLFQLSNGTTTLEVGQTTQRFANLSGIPAFCAGKTCTVAAIHDHKGGPDLIPETSAVSPANGPTVCRAAPLGSLDCASFYTLDPNTGLPIITTVDPSEYTVSAPAITEGVVPSSNWMYGRNEQVNATWGTGHEPANDINGEDFIATIMQDAAGVYLVCQNNGDQCIGIDEEASTDNPNGTGNAYAHYGGNTDITVLITWDGVPTGHIKAYVNSATAVMDNAPPGSTQPPAGPSAFRIRNWIKFGGGGDTVHAQTAWREGLVANAELTSTDYTNLQNNVSAFYAGHTTPATCHGGGDLYMYAQPIGFPTGYSGYSGPFGGHLSYALIQTNASYFGPLADLNNGTTTQAFASDWAVNGGSCGLDSAAASFCTGGSLGHCEVSKLYNQTTLDTVLRNSPGSRKTQHDTTLDMVFASGQRPAVTFSSLNSLPTMHFSGGQYGCMTQASNFTSYYGFSAVAKRTSGSSYSTVFSLGGTTPDVKIGFDTTGNAGFFVNGAGTVDGAATESHWHNIMYESGGGLSFVDGVSGSVVANTLIVWPTTAYCIGARSDGSQALTGDIAEVDVFSVNQYVSAGWTSRGPLAGTVMQSVWGTLPN